MKTRILTIVVLLLILVVLLTRNNDKISDTLLNLVNPIKQKYKAVTQGLEDKSHSYIFQKETIEKFSHENRVLRKRLLEQMHYIEQVQEVYEILPQLSRLPAHNISIAETISYVKLNSFSQIILTKPKGIVEKKIYGLIQGTVVAGVSMVKNGQLYGYLTSDDKCRFSVFIGDKKAPGIAIGVEKNKMIIKFIPKWHNIQVGDKVVTSGLDEIFFRSLPVGIVTKVEVQSAYTVAYIKTYSNVMHPKTFFVINDPKSTLLEDFDNNKTKIALKCPKDVEKIYIDSNETYLIRNENTLNDSNLSDSNVSLPVQSKPEFNSTIPIMSSIPNRVDQTMDDVVEPEVPVEHPEDVKKPASHKKKKKTYKKKTSHPKSLDLF